MEPLYRKYAPRLVRGRELEYRHNVFRLEVALLIDNGNLLTAASCVVSSNTHRRKSVRKVGLLLLLLCYYLTVDTRV